MGQEAVPACAAMSTATTITTPMERTPNPHGWAASVEDTAGAATWTTNGIAAAAPRHPPLPLALRLDQLAKLLMISGQAMMWLGHVQKAEGLVNKLLPGVVTALMLVNVIIVWACPRFYWRHRAWLAPALRIMVLLPPSARSVQMGTALILEQPPRPGLRGFAGDVFRIFTGTRLFATFLGGIIVLLPPATALLTQCCVVALTFHPAGYCSTQLLRHPLWAGRLSGMAAGLELLTALPLAAALPLGSSEMLSRRVLSGQAVDPAATCHAAISFAQVALGVLVPVLVSALLWEPPGGEASGASGGHAAASNSPTRTPAGRRVSKLRSAAARRAAAADRLLHRCLAGRHSLAAGWLVCCVLWFASEAAAGLV